MALTYGCCSAVGSLCQSCLGSTGQGTTGRKRAVLLLTLAIALALWFQYAVGPSIVSQSGWVWRSYRWMPGLGKHVYSAWYQPCKSYINSKGNDKSAAAKHLLEQCAGNAGVYRPTAVSMIFFVFSAVATAFQPDLNREAWPAKYTVFLGLVTLTVLMNSSPWFTGVFLWIARLGATLFVLLQQVILIDVAYNWNEDWVDRADHADRLEYGSGQTWLQAIVGTCIAFYLTSLVGISLLYHYFGACSENNWIITLTLLGMIALTAVQLSGTEGSLLTSSVICLYATYLAYSMVSKNPDGSCNPQLGSNDVWGMAMGMTLTAVSLAWTGWSWTAQERLQVDGVQSTRSVTASSPMASSDGRINLEVPFLDPSQQPTAGMVLQQQQQQSSQQGNAVHADVWKLNVVMALISCWVAMTLTGWGTLDSPGEDKDHFKMANPTVGRVNMAMIGISQWLAILLYMWTLLAPRLYPDYDFS